MNVWFTCIDDSAVTNADMPYMRLGVYSWWQEYYEYHIPFVISNFQQNLSFFLLSNLLVCEQGCNGEHREGKRMILNTDN